MTAPYFLPRYHEELDDELIASVKADGVDPSFIDELPRLADLCEKLTNEDAYQLLQYMKACPMLIAFMSNERDPFSDDEPVINCAVFTDGTFIWRAMHQHLVENYRVPMPPKFMAHVKAFDGDYERLSKTKIPDLDGLRIGFSRFIYDQLKY